STTIAPRRPAVIVDGSRGLRSCDDRERCARLPRNRYSRAHRPLVFCRRRAGAGRRNGSDRWRSPVTRALCHCRARASGREIRSGYNRTANCAAVSQSSRNRRNYTVEFHVSRLSLTSEPNNCGTLTPCPTGGCCFWAGLAPPISRNMATNLVLHAVANRTACFTLAALRSALLIEILMLFDWPRLALLSFLFTPA